MAQFATYYKCALQVNPYSYARFRGHDISDEEEYNNAILSKCLSNNIAVVGLADHGRVDSSESLRKKLSENGILVFPGFEIASAERIHMVCLFPPEKNNSELNRFLGGLGLYDVSEGTEASKETCLEIADKVEKLGGFWYAAHITGDNGILKLGKQNVIWQDHRLVAAQIPDNKENIDPKYRNIINNTDPNYRRDHTIAYINACDIEKPEDLDKITATTLIKMSELSFESFVVAFKDPESRVKLNFEIEDNYQSSIRSVSVFGGYLDGFCCELSNNLTTIIGGRGTGKSTIINLIRYALDLHVDRNVEKDFNSMITSNLGSTGRVEVDVISNNHFGQPFKIIRRYRQNPVVLDQEGNVSQLTVRDILPTIEIYGQNEIMDVVREPLRINKIVQRLLPADLEIKRNLDLAYTALVENDERLKELETEIETREKQLSDLPAIKERLDFYQRAGIDQKLTVVRKLADEEAIFETIKKGIPERILLTRVIVMHSEDEQLQQLEEAAKVFNATVENLEKQYEIAIEKLKEDYALRWKLWQENRLKYDDALKKSLEDVEGIQDKTSTQIVEEYSELVKKVSISEPKKKQEEEYRIQRDELLRKRKTLIERYKECCDKSDRKIGRSIKKLNSKKLNGKVRINLKFRQQKTQLLTKLKEIDGIGDRSLTGIVHYDDFDVFTFAENVRLGAKSLQDEYALTVGTSEKICKTFTESDLRAIEQMKLDDLVLIELEVNGRFKPLYELSKGQQCTAILNILLLDNKDPLIVDQPEDNLDNSFIADSLVDVIRRNKIKRQYIFATHNANIPVFGDAELILAMEEVDAHGRISENGIGSIDSSGVREKVIQILEGGPEAFKMREDKYGIM